MATAYDVGKAINRDAVEGQMQGGVAMGIGQALTEEVVIVDGYTLNASFADYLLPTAVDVPSVETIVVESGQGLGPFGAKGIGEPALTPTPAAIANAVADAIGARVLELPLTPERVHWAMRKKDDSKTV
jgi:CO/xanthine dehydrogenase Mo-binding subunit